MAALPPDCKAAVALRYWRELSYEEIAETFSSTVPIKTVIY
jgi:DNA-directed RNA polymerase specialized sigma24 family protein